MNSRYQMSNVKGQKSKKRHMSAFIFGKRSLVVALGLCSLLYGTFSFNSVTAQTDVPEGFADVSPAHPYYSDIIELQRKGLVSGYEDNTFRPDALITRAEFVKLTLGAGNCVDCEFPSPEVRARYNTAPFPDIPVSAWYFYCVAGAKDAGLITGYLGTKDQGLYLPDAEISRAESIAILLRAVGTPPHDNDPLVLQDVDPDAWYVGYLKAAVNTGLLAYHKGFLAPEEKIQRGEFAHLVNTVMQSRQCTRVTRFEPERGNSNRNDIPVSDANRNRNNGLGNTTNNNSAIPGINQNGNGSGNGNTNGNISQNLNNNQGDEAQNRNTNASSVTNRNGNSGNQNAGSLSNRNTNGNISSNTNQSPVLNDNDNRGENQNNNGGTPIISANTNQNNTTLADRDQDTVPDAVDLCPDLPGDLFPAKNQSGCPDVGNTSGNFGDTGLIVKNPACNMCPCAGADFKADLRPGDIIFSVIPDPNNQRIYQKSELYYMVE